MSFKRTFILIALIQCLLLLDFSYAQNDPDALLGQLQAINKDSCGVSVKPVELKTVKLPNTEISVSVVTKAEAQKLFEEMKNQKDIPYRYPEDGCYARAHKMAMLLEQKGITVGKAFLEGDLQVNTTNSKKGYVKWWFHVAPVLLVKQGDKTIPYILDPSTFDEPVPVDRWTGLQTCDNQKECKDAFYYTNRFSYFPEDRYLYASMWSAENSSEMEKILKEYKEIEVKREAKKKLLKEQKEHAHAK